LTRQNKQQREQRDGQKTYWTTKFGVLFFVVVVGEYFLPQENKEIVP
jgi:hypothetical protein